MKRILVLLAHPSIENSTVNRALFDAATANEQVTTVNLYEEYPDFTINVSLEQERLLNHGVVVFLFPTFWYSTPALLKEWQDKVLEYGFAYGSSGNKLHRKILLCATSTGSTKSAVDFIGYFASFFIIMSLTTTNVKKFRYINLLGCSTFLAYGIITHAYPVIVLNVCCIIINLFNMNKLRKKTLENLIWLTFKYII